MKNNNIVLRIPNPVCLKFVFFLNYKLNPNFETKKNGASKNLKSGGLCILETFFIFFFPKQNIC